MDALEAEAAARTGPSVPEARLARWPGLRDELLLAGALAFVFAAHAAASLAAPNMGHWGDGREDGFLLHLAISLTGLFVVAVPAMLVHALVLWRWDGTTLPQAEAVACWSAAALAGAVVALAFPRVPAWRRAVYGYLAVVLLGGFAGVQWSGLGS